jgi:hypothetical protein
VDELAKCQAAPTSRRRASNPAKTYNVVKDAKVRFTRMHEATQLAPFQTQDL